MKKEDLKNGIRIIGELIKKEVTRMHEGEGKEAVSLRLTVRTGEVEEHTVSFFAYKYTSKDENGNRIKDESKISRLFTGYETVINEYKSVDDENGDGTGDLVDIKGSLSKNAYVDKSGQYREGVRLKGTFCSRVIPNPKYTPCARWEAHMYISSIKEDMSDRTGEFVLVKGIIVGYTEDEFDFRIYNEKVKKGFLKRFDAKDALRLEGNIVNRPDEAVNMVVEDEEDSWGEELEVSVSSDTIRRNYLEILTGDTRTMDTDDEEHPFNEYKIKEYRRNMAKRKSDVIAKSEEKKQEESNRQAINPNSGFSSIDDEEIPF